MPTYTGYQQYKDQSRAQTVPPANKLPPTTADIEGPFYKAGAPMRDQLCDAPALHLTGRVMDIDGYPIVGACLDFWQADAEGEYDNKGFQFRGKQSVGTSGEYHLNTIRPGDYKIADDPPDFRCAHIHVKVTADGFKPLTTQLYFPDDGYNATDHWFSKDRVIQIKRPGEWGFDFILERTGV